MILTAKCVGCGHIMNIRPDCPTTFSCSVCGFTYFTFNHDIKIRNNKNEYTLPKGNELDAKDGSPVWTITQVLEPPPPPSPPVTEKPAPKIMFDEPEEVKEEKPEFPKPSPLKKTIERYKVKKRTSRKSPQK